MTQLLLRECSTCGGPRAFEAPGCPDGHGSDCPDLACVDCGGAIFVGLLDGWHGELAEPRAPVAPAA